MFAFSKEFWTSALERAAKTAAQSLIVALGAGRASDTSIPWVSALGIAVGSGLLSLVNSIGSALLGPYKGSPSLVSPLAISANRER